jgi:hypothetical protein
MIFWGDINIQTIIGKENGVITEGFIKYRLLSPTLAFLTQQM